MKTKNHSKRTSVLQRMLADKKALNECIRKGSDIKKVADERKIKLATPV